MKNKLFAICISLLYMLSYIFFNVLCYIPIILIISFYVSISDTLQTTEFIFQSNITIFSTLSSFLFLVFIYFFAKNILGREKILFAINLNFFRYSKIFFSILTGASLGIVISSIIELLKNTNMLNFQFSKYNQMMNTIISPKNTLVLIICAGFLMPFFEEVLFRGVIMNEFRKISSIFFTIIAQSILFGLIHFNITHFNFIQITYTFLCGIIFGVIYIWTNSLWSPILAHMSFNIINILLSTYVSVDFLKHNLIYILIYSTILFIISLKYISQKSKYRVLLSIQQA